eukprot:3141635-Rhodomonas_salina.3
MDCQPFTPWHCGTAAWCSGRMRGLVHELAASYTGLRQYRTCRSRSRLVVAARCPSVLASCSGSVEAILQVTCYYQTCSMRGGRLRAESRRGSEGRVGGEHVVDALHLGPPSAIGQSHARSMMG